MTSFVIDIKDENNYDISFWKRSGKILHDLRWRV